MMLLPDGLIPYSYSPFTADNKLDLKVLRERLERVLEGFTGLHGPANHSEMVTLDFEEWKQWTDVMMDVARENNLGKMDLQKTAHFGLWDAQCLSY